MRVLFPFCLLCLSGCMANDGLGSAAVASDNVNNLSRISDGMSQAQILQIMRQPYFCETYILGEDTYDVWFYVTRRTALGQSRMVPLNLTPLTFKNGALVGWGYGYYHSLFNKKKEPSPPPSTPQKPAEENIEIEKTLQQPKVTMSKAPNPPPPESKEEDGEGEGSEEKKRLDEKDQRMLEEADEQNFDFW